VVLSCCKLQLVLGQLEKHRPDVQLLLHSAKKYSIFWHSETEVKSLSVFNQL